MAHLVDRIVSGYSLTLWLSLARDFVGFLLSRILAGRWRGEERRHILRRDGRSHLGWLQF